MIRFDCKQDFKRRCQEKIGQDRGWNSLVPTDSIPISAKTISNYIQEGDFATRKGQVKTSGRSEAKTGGTTCIIEKITDRNFPAELKLQPMIICLNRSTTNFFVSLSHPKSDEIVAQVHQHKKKCIIPAMLQKQQQAIQRDIGGFDDSVIHGSQSQPLSDLVLQESPYGILLLINYFLIICSFISFVLCRDRTEEADNQSIKVDMFSKRWCVCSGKFNS